MQMAPMTITKYWALIYPYDTPLGLNWFLNGWKLKRIESTPINRPGREWYVIA